MGVAAVSVDDARPLARLEAMILRFAASRQGNYTVRYKCARKLCDTMIMWVPYHLNESLVIFVSKKVGNQKNLDHFYYIVY